MRSLWITIRGNSGLYTSLFATVKILSCQSSFFCHDLLARVGVEIGSRRWPRRRRAASSEGVRGPWRASARVVSIGKRGVSASDFPVRSDVFSAGGVAGWILGARPFRQFSDRPWAPRMEGRQQGTAVARGWRPRSLPRKTRAARVPRSEAARFRDPRDGWFPWKPAVVGTRGGWPARREAGVAPARCSGGFGRRRVGRGTSDPGHEGVGRCLRAFEHPGRGGRDVRCWAQGAFGPLLASRTGGTRAGGRSPGGPPRTPPSSEGGGNGKGQWARRAGTAVRVARRTVLDVGRARASARIDRPKAADGRGARGPGSKDQRRVGSRFRSRPHPLSGTATKRVSGA